MLVRMCFWYAFSPDITCNASWKSCVLRHICLFLWTGSIPVPLKCMQSFNSLKFLFCCNQEPHCRIQKCALAFSLCRKWCIPWLKSCAVCFDWNISAWNPTALLSWSPPAPVLLHPNCFIRFPLDFSKGLCLCSRILLYPIVSSGSVLLSLELHTCNYGQYLANRQLTRLFSLHSCFFLALLKLHHGSPPPPPMLIKEPLNLQKLLTMSLYYDIGKKEITF